MEPVPGSDRDPAAAPVELIDVRADNPGPMTLTGTRTYVLRDGAQCAVVDPGPLDAGHLAAVLRACGLAGVSGGAAPRCVGVLVTHRHADHSAGAGTLRRQLENRTGHPVPLWAEDRAALPGAVTPPAVIHGDNGTIGHVIHLPGHTADSLGLLVAGGLMLTGDTLLGGGSSTVISPPDGDVTEHLQSLAVLRAMAIDGRISSIHPGHGDPYEDPLAALDAIEQQIAHREERIAQVRRARAKGLLTLEALLPAVYGPDLSAGLRPAAGENLRAILRHLARE